MNSLTDERLFVTARWLSNGLAMIVVALPVGVLTLGWIAGVSGVVNPGITPAEMVRSTAISFVLLGAGLLWCSLVQRVRYPVVLCVSGIVAGLSILDLFALVGGVHGGIEGLFIEVENQGKMACATAVQFLLGSCCLGGLAEPRLWRGGVFSGCATGGLLISLVAVVGHLFDASALSEIWFYSGMAPHTAAVAALLHAALLLRRPEGSWVDLVLGSGSGSASARRLLPLAIVGPILLCFGTLALVRAGIFNVNFRLSLLTIALTTISAIAILRNAAVLNRAERASLHDPLTDLPNRALFADELGRAVAEARETRAKVGLALVDLDRFKSINQVLGNAIGDAVLRSIAKRLVRLVGDADTLARVGGDEFALVLVARKTRGEIEMEVQRLHRALMSPARINDGQIESSASLGVAIFPDDASEPKSLWRCADLAVSTCKLRGRRGICYFDQEIEGAAMRRARVESDLRSAIEGHQLRLEYQPLFELASRRIAASRRWCAGITASWVPSRRPSSLP